LNVDGCTKDLWLNAEEFTIYLKSAAIKASGAEISKG